MHTDEDFLRKILENPADDTTRLVYADWLDEQDDPVSKAKARFLRLTVQLLEQNRTQGWRKGRRKELQRLAATLDTNWLAIVSRLKVEMCAGQKRAEAAQGRIRLRFDFVCDKRWDELTTTDDRAVRFCEGCKQAVHYCDTITVARNHARQGHCIAVDLGIPRREGDVNSTRMMTLGRPSPASLERQRKQNEVDEVSRERERRKQEQDGPAGG